MPGDDLNRVTAAVLGAREGIGSAVVDALREAGARLAIDGGSFDQTNTLRVIPTENGPQAFFDRCEAELGDVDILVISARPVGHKPVLAVTEAELRDVIEQDLVQVALFMQEAARRMVERRHGRIIVFASMSGKTGAHHNVSPFAAAKGGLLAFVRAMAAEIAPSGVTVNAIATALFEPQVAAMSEEKRAGLKTGIPVGRFGRPEEAAQAVLYLASQNAGYVTGECLNLSGGRFMD